MAESPVESLAPSVPNTFSTNFVVEPGDLVGFWANDQTDCITAPVDPAFLNPSNPGAQPPVGSTIIAPAYGGYLLNITATLTALTKADCMSGGWQSYGVFKNQGDCVSFVATGGKNLPAN